MPHGARSGAVLKAWTKADAAAKWEATSWAKKLAARVKRANLSDFERFVVKVTKQQVRRFGTLLVLVVVVGVVPPPCFFRSVCHLLTAPPFLAQPCHRQGAHQAEEGQLNNLRAGIKYRYYNTPRRCFFFSTDGGWQRPHMHGLWRGLHDRQEGQRGRGGGCHSLA